MTSRIYEDEKVRNKDRKFGSALDYYPVSIIDPQGRRRKAHFTAHQIEEAIERAKVNPEDFPLTIWEKVKGWFK